jgi:hypothetical protein
MKCKFCGREVHREKYLSANKKDITCGECTSYCMKKCELGNSGKSQGWNFEPCLTCDKNPYKTKNITFPLP